MATKAKESRTALLRDAQKALGQIARAEGRVTPKEENVLRADGLTVTVQRALRIEATDGTQHVSWTRLVGRPVRVPRGLIPRPRSKWLRVWGNASLSRPRVDAGVGAG